MARGRATPGSGTADPLPELSIDARIDPDEERRAHPGTFLRSTEKCWYHRLLAESVDHPTALLANVARWSDR